MPRSSVPALFHSTHSAPYTREQQEGKPQGHGHSCLQLKDPPEEEQQHFHLLIYHLKIHLEKGRLTQAGSTTAVCMRGASSAPHKLLGGSLESKPALPPTSFPSATTASPYQVR